MSGRRAAALPGKLTGWPISGEENEMGKSYDYRRRLRQYCLDTYGDGTAVVCVAPECTEILTIDTLTLDHYPIPRRAGGTLRPDNVRPMCGPCNHSHVDEPGYEEWERRQAVRRWRDGSKKRKENQPILTYKIRNHPERCRSIFDGDLTNSVWGIPMDNL
jgi:hypothetical protein